MSTGVKRIEASVPEESFALVASAAAKMGLTLRGFASMAIYRMAVLTLKEEAELTQPFTQNRQIFHPHSPGHLVALPPVGFLRQGSPALNGTFDSNSAVCFGSSLLSE